MKKYLFAIGVLVSCNSFAASPALIDLSGKYSCEGNEVVTNAAYKCEMTINKTSETYASTATCNDGTSYIGISIYNEKLQQLSTAFINPNSAKEAGIAVSDVKPDGSMNTVWTYLNNTSVGHSTCNKQSA